ncbi:MAG TPA: Rieske 2Fe-2S domain-containing protein [Chloroflexota bacterium]|nr:Rieske 2Fe-2S domain-containing protein [Chloroflexota bacterium]
MLTKTDNELLTRVGPGTPMGDTLRQYWLPLLLTEELADNEGNPQRVRVLGENLIAFRDTEGAIGLLAENCPHRGASLFFARNEQCGLRCVYHGWKFGVDGTCLDMPNEPPESNFKERVRAVAYACVERGGVLWAYMGPPEHAAEPPELEWTHVPADHRYVTKRIQLCNYLQNVEGEVDSSHVSFLHSKPSPSVVAPLDQRNRLPEYMARDRAPRFFVKPTDYGMLIGARREAEADSYYWRITQFLLPTYTMIPGPVGEVVNFTSATPIDDSRMIGFTVTWHPDRPLNAQEIAGIESWTGIHTEVDPKTFMPLRNIDNDYLLDRAAQASGRTYTGIRGVREEDLAVQEGMGTIVERTTEHLGSADLAIIATRRRLLDLLESLAEHGTPPFASTHGDTYRVRSAALVLPRETPWDEGASEAMLARV